MMGIDFFFMCTHAGYVNALEKKNISYFAFNQNIFFPILKSNLYIAPVIQYAIPLSLDKYKKN